MVVIKQHYLKRLHKSLKILPTLPYMVLFYNILKVVIKKTLYLYNKIYLYLIKSDIKW